MLDPVTGTRLLEYLGLRRTPNSLPDSAGRAFTGVMLVCILLTGFLTRDLGWWAQLLIGSAGAAVLGIVCAAMYVRRHPRT